jgi:hypothetical protein
VAIRFFAEEKGTSRKIHVMEQEKEGMTYWGKPGTQKYRFCCMEVCSKGPNNLKAPFQINETGLQLN